MTYAVLSGDLVKSTRLSAAELDDAMVLIEETLQRWNEHAHRFTRNRGDGWQAVLMAPSQAMEVTLWLIAHLRMAGLSSRIAIGVGAVEQFGRKDLSDAWGPAFVASGHALDRMQRGQTLAIAGPMVSNEDKALIALLDERTSRWTRAQAEAVTKSMDPSVKTDQDAARSLGITPQAMSDRLYGAGYPTMCFATTLWREAKNAQGWDDPDD